MRILIFGANGMLGHKLIQRLATRFEVGGTIRGGFSSVERFEIFDREKTLERIHAESKESIEKAISAIRPDVVINAIGIIKQVPSAKDVVSSLEVNAIFPHRLAELSSRYGFRLINISTDCVFDGKKGNYSESDPPNATDLYGKSKNLGEVIAENCLTIRTSIIGRELDSSHSLIEWFLSNRGGSVKGFVEAIYSGFPTTVLADIIGNLLVEQKDLSGIYHVAAEPINKFDLLNLVNKYYNASVTITPSNELKIDRSMDASKFNELTGFKPKSWDQMIREMASDPTPYDSFRK